MRLNIGSGQRPFERPWINIDIQSKFNPDIVWDVTDAANTPVEINGWGGMADTICLHHVLEHFTLDESRSVVTACRQLLKTGGSLLVFVPDIEKLITARLHGIIDEYTLLVNIYGANMGDKADLHKWGYTAASLRRHLGMCSDFRRIMPFDWRKIEGADIARDWWILGMEAVK